MSLANKVKKNSYFTKFIYYLATFLKASILYPGKRVSRGIYISWINFEEFMYNKWDGSK